MGPLPLYHVFRCHVQHNCAPSYVCGYVQSRRRSDFRVCIFEWADGAGDLGTCFFLSNPSA